MLPTAEPQMYEFLAQALLYPRASFVAQMRARFDALKVVYPWAQQMTDALARQELEDLQVEHVRLFVNALEGAHCLPYESIYAEEQVLGEVAQEVGALYADWGLQETGEMPDHAAVELAFAAQLARLCEMVEDGEDRHRLEQVLAAFERDHLRSWLPNLAVDLASDADSPFYQGLAIALQETFGAAGNAGRARSRAIDTEGPLACQLRTDGAL